MEDMRKQLEELMSSVGSGTAKPKTFTDPAVCKHYLCGLCPHDLFHNTRIYMGVCRYFHSDELREEFLKAREERIYGYEEESIRYMRPTVDDCDRKIAKQIQERGEDIDQVKQSIQSSAQKELDSLGKEIHDSMQEAQELGTKGEVDDSMKVMERLSTLEARKRKLENDLAQKLEETRTMWFQKLRPCEICGALLSERDDESRLNEHFSGRIHLGFEAMRQQITKLQEHIASKGRSLPRALVVNTPPPMPQPSPARKSTEVDDDPSMSQSLYSRDDFLRDTERERQRERELEKHTERERRHARDRRESSRDYRRGDRYRDDRYHRSGCESRYRSDRYDHSGRSRRRPSHHDRRGDEESDVSAEDGEEQSRRSHHSRRRHHGERRDRSRDGREEREGRENRHRRRRREGEEGEGGCLTEKTRVDEPVEDGVVGDEGDDCRVVRDERGHDDREQGQDERSQGGAVDSDGHLP